MAKPVLTINGHDYAPYLEELTMSRNDLDAEGSGRDVQTGLMYRTRIASKLKAEARFLPVGETVHKQLLADVSGTFFAATVIDPTTGAAAQKSFYVSTVPFGAQRYDRESGKPYYSGLTLTMIER